MISFVLFSLLFNGLLAAEVCYPPCGCFTNDPPHDGRPLPESPDVQQIQWRLYTRDNPNIGSDISLTDTVVPPDFVPAKQTKYLIHGWISSPGAVTYATMLEIKNVMLDNLDVNVIVVDWSVGAADPLYVQAMTNTRVVGACSGQISIQLGSPSGNVHCTGHSLGGHTCGYMGEYLNGDMGRATGLDPAGPGFGYDNDTRLRLDPTDAQFVDIMHTNVEAIFPLGIGTQTGHVDFYPNKGYRQPGCGTSSCSHSICTDYYMASIDASTSCNFWAYPCASDTDADAGLCDTCIEGVNCQKMGYYANTQPGRGTYFLETDAAYPHCQT